MAFGLGLPPHKYVLDTLGTRLRDYYNELLDRVHSLPALAPGKLRSITASAFDLCGIRLPHLRRRIIV